MCQVWCSIFKASIPDWRRCQSAIGICTLFYIYRFAIRCAKFGVVVFNASIAQLQGAICHGYMCIVLYMKLIWCNGFA